MRRTHRESEAPGKSFNRMHSNNDWHCLHSFYSFPNELPYYDESQVSSHYPYSFHYCGKVISSVFIPDQLLQSRILIPTPPFVYQNNISPPTITTILFRPPPSPQTALKNPQTTFYFLSCSLFK